MIELSGKDKLIGKIFIKPAVNKNCFNQHFLNEKDENQAIVYDI